MINFFCIHCGREIRVPDSAAGKQGKCPDCFAKVRVPNGPDDEREPTQAPPPIKSKKAKLSLDDLSDDAVTPKAPQISKQNLVGCLFLAMAFPVVGFLVCAGLIGSHKPSASDDSSVMKAGAWLAAQEYVKRNLKAPSTASFGGFFEQPLDECVKDLGNGLYHVKGWVDAQNGFGAMIRTKFSLAVEDNKNGTWKVIEN